MAADKGLRKLAAILAADVAGYSRLMADDERATVETLTDYREVFSELVKAHQGRIVDTAGDSVLATFDSVVEAVEAAVEIQRELADRNEQLPDHRRMHFRIGVNLGDIIVRDDGTVYGDGVNVAARLESLAEPGGINVSGTGYDHIRGKLEVGYEFLGDQKVKNIPDPVRAYRLLPAGSPRVSSKSGIKRQARLIVGITTAIVLIVGGVALWQFSRALIDFAETPGDEALDQDPVLAMPTGPRIAVLPFENLSGDPEQDYFSDGLTEDLITSLSRFESVLVFARNATSQYKGQQVDPRQVSHDLSAGYVIAGSVRKMAASFRVSVKLLDARDGSNLWSDSYDRELTASNLFAVQDEVTEQVAATLADVYGVLSRSGMEAVSSKAPESLAPYECWLRLISYYDRIVPDEHYAVRECMRNAVVSEPDYPLGWLGLAWITLDEVRFNFDPEPDSLARAEEAVRRAIRLDRDNEIARHCLAIIYFYKGDLDSFLAEAERAVALNPNASNTLADIGSTMMRAGHPERGMALTRKAMALNPAHPGWFYFAIARYHLLKSDYDQALEAVSKINMPGFYLTHLQKAVVLGLMGRTREARESLERLKELDPTYADNIHDRLRQLIPDETLRAIHVDGLRTAGLAIPDEPALTD